MLIIGLISSWSKVTSVNTRLVLIIVIYNYKAIKV